MLWRERGSGRPRPKHWCWLCPWSRIISPSISWYGYCLIVSGVSNTPWPHGPPSSQWPSLPQGRYDTVEEQRTGVRMWLKFECRSWHWWQSGRDHMKSLLGDSVPNKGPEMANREVSAKKQKWVRPWVCPCKRALEIFPIPHSHSPRSHREIENWRGTMLGNKRPQCLHGSKTMNGSGHSKSVDWLCQEPCCRALELSLGLSYDSREGTESPALQRWGLCHQATWSPKSDIMFSYRKVTKKFYFFPCWVCQLRSISITFQRWDGRQWARSWGESKIELAGIANAASSSKNNVFNLYTFPSKEVQG